MTKVKRIAITPGEPAGIGPDLVLSLAQQNWPHELVICANAQLMVERAALLGLPVEIIDYDPARPPQPHQAGTLVVANQELKAPVKAGELNEKNGHYVLDTLARAAQGCLSGEFAAVVTGPVHKGVINRAGVSFSGHTEFFAQQSNTAQVVMMLATQGLRGGIGNDSYPAGVCVQGDHRRAAAAAGHSYPA